MKKYFVTVCLFLVILSGCKSKINEEAIHHEETKMMREKSDTSENSQDSSSFSAEAYPYAVSIDELVITEDQGGGHPVVVKSADFISSGNNSPSRISLSQGTPYSLGICVYVYPCAMGNSEQPSEPVMYPVRITNRPTKEITLFSGIGTDHQKRKVKVNTELVLHAYENGQDGYTNLAGNRFYLFHNAQGTVSLATKNFAGNVLEEDLDVMMEYLQE